MEYISVNEIPVAKLELILNSPQIETPYFSFIHTFEKENQITGSVLYQPNDEGRKKMKTNALQNLPIPFLAFSFDVPVSSKGTATVKYSPHPLKDAGVDAREFEIFFNVYKEILKKKYKITIQ